MEIADAGACVSMRERGEISYHQLGRRAGPACIVLAIMRTHESWQKPPTTAAAAAATIANAKEGRQNCLAEATNSVRQRTKRTTTTTTFVLFAGLFSSLNLPSVSYYLVLTPSLYYRRKKLRNFYQFHIIYISIHLSNSPHLHKLNID